MKTLRGAKNSQPARAVLVGSAPAIRSALVASSNDVVGACVVGPGDAGSLPVLSRAPAWDALTFAGVEAERALLAEPAPARQAAGHVLNAAADAGLRVFLLEDGAARPMTLDDLIGRTLDAVDWERVGDLIEGRRVLITGGGGSIGGELARRLTKLSPARLCLLDASEYNLFQISQALPSAVLALADVRDENAVRRWFERERPHLVFHAAALKQVPMVEAHPCEGVLTNVVGCRNVADAAFAIGADLVFISTDKAVNPTGAMGATKRLAGLYCRALDCETGERGGPRSIVARLGNVLGTAGSVLPVFAAQLAAGEPLTVTDPDVTRYFMTVSQAADFLMQAAATARSGACGRGAVLVRDMGEAIPIVELARKLIRLEGKRPDADVPITFMGLRPGEKLHEQLIGVDEWCEADPAPGVMAAFAAPRSLAELREVVDRLALLARNGDDKAVVEMLNRAIAPVAPAEKRVAAAG